MNYYVIQYTCLINKVYETLYHQDIKRCRNKYTMNVYTEHLTSNAYKANKFYDKDEAYKVAQMFNKPPIQSCKIIKL